MLLLAVAVVAAVVAAGAALAFVDMCSVVAFGAGVAERLAAPSAEE